MKSTNKMKKIKRIFLVLGLLAVFSVPVLSLAVENLPQLSSTSLTTSSVSKVVDTIFNWIFGIVSTLTVLIFVLAGFYFVTAQGDPEKVGKAKQMMIYGVIGVVVMIIAKAIPYFIYTILE